jgi:protein-tyrosine phosphatase/ribose 5-phosphate isomerase B
VITVLLVCHANTARSVMAHALLERMLGERGVNGKIHVRSGGIANYARDGMLPSLDARLALGEIGIHVAEGAMTSIDLRRHPDLVAGADLILTMTGKQKEMLAGLPEAAGRPTYTLGEFAGDPADIEDPAMQGLEAFRASREAIERCLVRGIDRLLALAGVG